MRLQLSISRHTLPHTHILFSTASHPSAHTSSRNATIADLLHDINELVPLESEDGEWGLEDYVVEVAATADQDNVYEALHFQSIDSVLREDDEVVIRYLKSEELKGRRFGGRLQITGDGRHLVDGVVWGRRWLGAARAGARPGIEIPPRKRRRILATEEEDELQADEPLLAIMAEDEQDDDDYKDEEDSNEVKVVSAFEDADQNDAEDEEDEMGDVEEDEVQLLLKEAADVEDALDASEAVLESQLRSRTRLGKRKRIFEGGEEAGEFEGFSTPVKSPVQRQVQFEDDEPGSDSDGDSMLAETAFQQAQKAQENQIPNEAQDESSDSDFDSSSASSSSESDDGSVSDGGDGLPRSRRSRGRNVNTSETSSSGTSGSESEDSESSDSSSETSSDGTSDSESETSETSSSSESESDGEAKASTKAAAVKTTVPPQTGKPGVAFQLTLNTSPTSGAPPGLGKASTRNKNLRAKMVRQLKRLKREGLLPADADLNALRAYEANAGQSPPQSTEDETQLEAARIKALASVQEPEPVQPEEGEVENDSPEPSRETESYQPTAESIPEASATVEPTQEVPQSAPRSVKRSRLDVAASRRLLFGSLGLRAPKTQAEEQTLREKLDKSAKRRPADGRVECSSTPPPEETSQSVLDDSWKERLIISAVECTREGLKLDAPPFPFQQYSTKRKLKVVDQEPELDYGEAEPAKPEQPADMRFQDVPDPAERLKLKKLHASLPNFTVRECYEALQACKWDHNDARELLFESEASQPLGGTGAGGPQDTHRAGEVSDNGSRTVSFAKDEADGMPIPTDFAALVDLEMRHLLPGAVIAYKELWMDPTTFQPDVSPYRVAKVLDFDREDFVAVILAVKDRDKPKPRDPETGEVIISGFEIRSSEDDEPDDGIRELRFAEMMTPKLVEEPIQVPGSSAVPNLRGRHTADETDHQSSEVVPESVPSAQNKDSISLPRVEVQQIEIDTPRRTEITTLIKEAGFNSAMDEDLLEPLPSRGNRSPASSQPEVNTEKETSIVVEIPSQAAIADISQAQTRGWNSSLSIPPQESTPHASEEDTTPLDNIQPTSSPPVSPQLTVEYPHISQMDLDSSFHGPEETSKNSSSHQDAQRVPAVPPVDVTLTITEEDEQGPTFEDDGDVSFEDEPMDELQSEVSQSQSQEPSNLQPLSEPNDDDAPTPRARSFLGRRGGDGPTSSPSFHPSDDDVDMPEEDGSGSESSLPSLTELTSSQRYKINPKTDSKSSLSKHVSPPPVARRSLKNNGVKVKISKTRKPSTPPKKLQASFDGADDDGDLDLPPSSQLEPASSIDSLQRDIKIAPSQKEKRMSQIPVGTHVVDLTMSSDPVSPSDSDSEYGPINRRGTLKGRKPNGKAKGKKSMLGTSVSDLGAGTGLGIGTRRFLTSKKSRSQI